MNIVVRSSGATFTTFYMILFYISWISRWYFKDILRPINSSITNTSFIISSSDPIKNSVKKNKKRQYIIC